MKNHFWETLMTLSLQEIIDGIHPLSREALEKARARTAQLVMPPRALGRLHAALGATGRLTARTSP